MLNAGTKLSDSGIWRNEVMQQHNSDIHQANASAMQLEMQGASFARLKTLQHKHIG